MLRYELSCREPSCNVSHELVLSAAFKMDAFVGDVLARLENAFNLGKRTFESELARIEDFAAEMTRSIVPEEIRRILWAHREDIKAVWVVADSPYMPWELLYIGDPEGSGAGAFLCEWGWSAGCTMPAGRLVLDDARVRFVIPDYASAKCELKGAAEERQMLLELFPRAKPIKAEFEAVRRHLKEAATCDVLHFACHGLAEQKAVLRSELILEGAEQDGKVFEDRLGYETVKRAASFGEGEQSSLVFINACQTGRAGEGIAGVAGFAEAFLRPNSRKGAAIFVGALWSVDDSLAKNFASAFYSALLRGEPLVTASKTARAACKKGDFTWLAYSIYGNPFARVRSLVP